MMKGCMKGYMGIADMCRGVVWGDFAARNISGLAVECRRRLSTHTSMHMHDGGLLSRR
jgi:hypothetical protein